MELHLEQTSKNIENGHKYGVEQAGNHYRSQGRRQTVAWTKVAGE